MKTKEEMIQKYQDDAEVMIFTSRNGFRCFKFIYKILDMKVGGRSITSKHAKTEAASSNLTILTK